MTTVPEEAVKAAWKAYVTYIGNADGQVTDAKEALISGLTAAIPFLSLQVVKDKFKGTVDGDTELQAAARHAGWALIELVDEIDWLKREQVSDIITRLGIALNEPADGVGNTEVILEPSAARKELMKQIREGTAHGFLNDGSQPEGNPDLDCPYCCGSGHKGDVHPSAARSLALEEAAQVAEMLPECDLLSVNGNEVSPAVNDAFKRGAFAQGKAIAAAIRALSSPDHADASKVEGDGSRWRVFEAAVGGYWGIELEQASNDDDPILYPIKVHRDTLARIVDAHNADLPSAPSEGAE